MEPSRAAHEVSAPVARAEHTRRAMKTRTWMMLLLASALTAGWVHHADAQPALTPSREAAQPSTRRKVDYYGWQILLTDVASVAAGVAVGKDDHPDKGFAVFGGGYVLGGPIVHLSHGNPGRAVGSLALRVGLPALGAWALFGPEPECHDTPETEGSCGEDVIARAVGGTLLALVGMTTASLLDWTVMGLSIEEVPVEPGLTLVPQVSAGGGGSLQFGVLGRF